MNKILKEVAASQGALKTFEFERNEKLNNASTVVLIYQDDLLIQQQDAENEISDMVCLTNDMVEALYHVVKNQSTP